MGRFAIDVEDVRRAAAHDRRPRPAHAAGPGPAPVRAHRRDGVRQAREHAGDRLLQGARRASTSSRACAGGAPARRHRHVGRQPRPGGRLPRQAPRHPGDDRDAGPHAAREGREHARPWRHRGPLRRDASPSGRAGACDRERARASSSSTPTTIPPVMAGQGTVALEMLADAPISTARRADRRRRPDLGHRRRREGAEPDDRDRRRRGGALSLLLQRHPRRGPADRRRDAGRGHRGQDRRRS